MYEIYKKQNVYVSDRCNQTHEAIKHAYCLIFEIFHLFDYQGVTLDSTVLVTFVETALLDPTHQMVLAHVEGVRMIGLPLGPAL